MKKLLLTLLLITGAWMCTPLNAQLVKRVVGTGNTTGHIATLSIQNTGESPETIVLGPFYIPSGGQYQPYIVPGIKEVTVPPGATIQVEIMGFCADIYRPPVPAGEPMLPFSDWIKPDMLPSEWQPLPQNGWSKGIVKLPSGTAPLIPGTDIPLGHTIDMDKHPEEIAPILLEAVNNIISTFDELKAAGVIQTPFSGNPEKERESVIQQTLWIYSGGITGREYEKEAFTDQLVKQYESATGKDFEESPVQVQEQVTDGVDDFWNTFMLVGAKAKIISATTTGEVPTEPSAIPLGTTTEKSGMKCEPDEKVICFPDSCFDFQIQVADSWGDQEERDSIKAKLTRQLGKQNDNSEDTGKEEKIEYGIGKAPAAAYAFWKENHVGGQVAAYAKALFSKDRGDTEWVGSTDPVTAVGTGKKEITLSFEGDKGCTSFISGVALARVKASSFAFDAAAGNTEYSLTALKILYEVGDIAIDLALTRGKITGKKLVEKLKDYIKDKYKDELKDMAKDAAEELVGEKLRELAKEYGIDLGDLDLDDIPDPEISMEKIVPAGAKTKAEAEGELNLTIGSKKGSAKAASFAYYQRKGLEDKSETLTGSGSKCHEVIVSDSKPGSLTSIVHGYGKSKGEAEGNGYADAALESMYAMVMIGVCNCPDGTWSWASASDAGFYSRDGLKMDLVNLNFDDMINETAKTLENAASRNQASLQQALEQAMKKWSSAHPLIFKDCATE